MKYVERFEFPDVDFEEQFINGIKRTCYDTYYPFRTFTYRLEQLDFTEPVTILYGENGSGKSTALNVLAQKLNLTRDAVFNQSNFYSDYVAACEVTALKELPAASRIITSDDVFEYLLNIRSLNAGIDEKRETLFEEFLDVKYSDFKYRTMADYDELKRVNKARRKTQSKFVRSELMDNVPSYSNGESAFLYFTEKITENALFILDEPENSLSPKRQKELAKFIEDAARFFGCQIVMATHSPFLLAIKGAKIYDFDGEPISVKKWTELENVRLYYEFFMAHQGEF